MLAGEGHLVKADKRRPLKEGRQEKVASWKRPDGCALSSQVPGRYGTWYGNMVRGTIFL